MGGVRVCQSQVDISAPVDQPSSVPGVNLLNVREVFATMEDAEFH